jgi:hypothetical protein
MPAASMRIEGFCIFFSGWLPVSMGKRSESKAEHAFGVGCDRIFEERVGVKLVPFLEQARIGMLG